MNNEELILKALEFIATNISECAFRNNDGKYLEEAHLYDEIVEKIKQGKIKIEEVE